MRKEQVLVRKGEDINPAWVNTIAMAPANTVSTVTEVSAVLAAGGSLPDGDQFYVITALGINGESAKSGELTATCGTGDNTIEVTFTTLEYVTDYRIYRGSSTGDYKEFYDFTTTATGNETITDDGTLSWTSIPSGLTSNLLAGGTLPDDDYYYVVTAITPSGETYPFVEVTETCATGDNTIELIWNSCDNAYHYIVYRGLSTGVYTEKKIVYGNYFIDNGGWVFEQGSPTPKVSAPIQPYTWGTISTESVVSASRLFYPATIVGGYQMPAESSITLRTSDNERYFLINLLNVVNQPTWNQAVESYNIQAYEDISTWLMA